MLSLNVRTPVHENNHTSHRVQDPSLIRISQQPPLEHFPKMYNVQLISGTNLFIKYLSAEDDCYIEIMIAVRLLLISISNVICSTT